MKASATPFSRSSFHTFLAALILTLLLCSCAQSGGSPNFNDILQLEMAG